MVQSFSKIKLNFENYKNENHKKCCWGRECHTRVTAGSAGCRDRPQGCRRGRVLGALGAGCWASPHAHSRPLQFHSPNRRARTRARLAVQGCCEWPQKLAPAGEEASNPAQPETGRCPSTWSRERHTRSRVPEPCTGLALSGLRTKSATENERPT